MFKRIAVLMVTAMTAATLFAFGCGKTSGDNGSVVSGSEEGQTYESGECGSEGWCGEQAITVTANIAGAEALFISSEASSALESISAGKAITVSSESPLFSVTTGGVISVLAAALEDGSDGLDSLPRLSFVAVSPIGHIVLGFEHPFRYTDIALIDGEEVADDEYEDPGQEGSPYMCQIYVVNKKINDPTLSTDDPPGLTCLTNELILNTWDFRAAMFQFDGDGGVYFTGHVPNNWKNVLVKWTPGTDDASTADIDESTHSSDGILAGTLSEVINANICFREYLVTNEGGVLYTGITSTSGDCDGTSFLRYKTPSGALQEITSGWWEYVFKPIESTDFSVSTDVSPNITVANTGQILFYGPDPEIATTPEWDDACLYKFNPDESGAARSVQIADCDIDMWRYIDFAPDTDTRMARCVEEKSMMGGGNIPEKILLADLNSDGDNYEIYVVGNIYEKKVGEYRCDLCVNTNSANSYCRVGDVLHFEATTAGACTAITGGEWTAERECYNQQVNDTDTGSVCETTRADFDINGQWCQQPAGDWKDTYSAFAWVIYNDNDTSDEDDDTRQIIRFSDSDEIVRNGWNIGNRLVYSAFNSTDGAYVLREIAWDDANDDGNVVIGEISKTDLLSGIEVYELLADPRSDHPGEWFFNGLRFSDNQYITGTFNPNAEDPLSTLETEAGITGQIETLVIVPEL